MGAKDTKVTFVAIKTDAGTAFSVDIPAPGISGEWLVKAVNLMPNADSAANATNYATLSANQAGTGIATSLTTATVAFTDGTERNFVLLTTAAAMAAREFGGSTDYLTIAVDHAASGVAIDISASVEWEQIS